MVVLRGASRLMRMTGVFPMVPKMLSWIMASLAMKGPSMIYATLEGKRFGHGEVRGGAVSQAGHEPGRLPSLPRGRARADGRGHPRPPPIHPEPRLRGCEPGR